MSPRSSLDFPDLTLINSEDLEEINHQNYLAWKAQNAQRRRESTTLFHLYQCRSVERMCMHAQFKTDSVRESEALKHIVERRITNACDCPVCEAHINSPRSESRHSRTSSSVSNYSTRINTVQSSDSVSSMSSDKSFASSPVHHRSRKQLHLVTSAPPGIRHHKRGGGFIAGPERSP